MSEKRHGGRRAAIVRSSRSSDLPLSMIDKPDKREWKGEERVSVVYPGTRTKRRLICRAAIKSINHAGSSNPIGGN